MTKPPEGGFGCRRLWGVPRAVIRYCLGSGDRLPPPIAARHRDKLRGRVGLILPADPSVSSSATRLLRSRERRTRRN